MVGSAIAYGIKRGVYQVKQVWELHLKQQQLREYLTRQRLFDTGFIRICDTLLVCTATALMILLAGTYNVTDAAGGVLYEGISGVNAGVGFTQGALDSVIHGFGYPMIAVMLAFFHLRH